MVVAIRPVAMVVMAVCALFLVMDAAFGTTVYHGYDKSYGVNNGNHQTKICDRENDGEQANVQNLKGNGRKPRTIDGDGAGGYCYTSPYYTNLVGHRSCESNGAFPDGCGRWSYNNH